MKEKEPIPPRYAATVASVIDSANKLLKTHAQLMPIAFVINDADKKLIPVGAQFPDIDAKDYFAETIKQMASRHNADAIIFLSESWGLSDVDARAWVAGDNAKYDYLMENHPRRLDQLMVQLECRDGCWLGRANLLPAKKGRKTGRFEWFKAGQTEGRFTHLLPVQYATPEQCEAFLRMAREKLLAAGIDCDRKFATRSMMDILREHIHNAPADKLTAAMLDEFIAHWREVTKGKDV